MRQSCVYEVPFEKRVEGPRKQFRDHEGCYSQHRCRVLVPLGTRLPLPQFPRGRLLPSRVMWAEPSQKAMWAVLHKAEGGVASQGSRGGNPHLPSGSGSEIGGQGIH